jgi:hypothetical protein
MGRSSSSVRFDAGEKAQVPSPVERGRARDNVINNFSIVQNASTPFETAPRRRLLRVNGWSVYFIERILPLALRRPLLAAVSKGRRPIAPP